MSLKTVDMDEYVKDPTNNKTTQVEAKDMPDGMKMEVKNPDTGKTFTFPAEGLVGGDYHKVIRAWDSTSDNTISEEDLQRYYNTAMKMDWQDGWYSTFKDKEEMKTPGYKHIPLGGSDTERVKYEIEQDWVKEIWDKINPGVNLIRHYLNGHGQHQSGTIHVDGWTGNQYTAIIYLTPNWQPEDGGSIELWTPNLTEEMRALAVNTPYGFSGSPEKHIVKSYWPKAGRVVVFDARIPHVARSVETDKFRVSLVFKGTTQGYETDKVGA